MNAPIESKTEAQNKTLAIKIIGVGGAGCVVVKHMAAGEFLSGVEFTVVNTDAREHASGCKKILLGQKITHGLGTGGDPEVGRAAATAQREELRAACSGADMIVLVAGLGGGLATGACPILAQAAKESGALVLVMATLPFEFEGARRQREAQQGLQQIKAAADAVICLPNQKLIGFVQQKSTVTDAFSFSRDSLAESIRGICRLLTQEGLVKVDFAALAAVTRGRHTENSFACVEASGEKRVDEIIEKLFKHPFLDEPKVLQESESVLANIIGGPDLGMHDVNGIMAKINLCCPNAHIVFGVASDAAYADKISITFIASRRGKFVEIAEGDESEGPPRFAVSEMETQFHKEPTPRPASRYVAPAPDMGEEKKESFLKQRSKGRQRKKVLMQQGQLPLEIISRGRFEKSEPTIHQGEDLDVPTYLRKGVLLN